ncbi:hemolysin family protein [Gordonia sp. (in: high G+C Gram-positive bacteria)]|uniref:hemolysin family protein n=1 Tax=Gordonia sp. (in: high G+C Gram-positive bacteria) TaxID=84139 RepID=UPI0016917947|nr:hemolysin family protein [Gordonia sp. (in: high G+C Gram-positive bacteria)]NLG46350.1 HlyC/CorC family transporter [Gordonia sp. (in: high G+C Gram-positive bacteria)]
MNDWWGLLLAVVLLAANAFFVAAEFSLIAARRDRLVALEESGKKRARTVINASEHLSSMLAGSQLGITICSILLGRVAEPAIAHLIAKPMAWVGIPDQLLHPIAFAIGLAIVVILHILIGEMVPKNIALAGPETVAMLVMPMHLLFMRLTKPLIWFYNMLANVMLRIFGVEPKDELAATVNETELADMIVESRALGLLDADEHERLTRALTTVERTVTEVMIPLDTVRSVRVQLDAATGGLGPRLGSVERAVRETGFSRFPVRGLDGSFIGYLHIKDVLDDILDETVGPDSIIGVDQIRPLPKIPRATPLDEASVALRRISAHLGAVVDDEGGIVGVLALADLAEAFIGDVRDSTHRV